MKNNSIPIMIFVLFLLGLSYGCALISLQEREKEDGTQRNSTPVILNITTKEPEIATGTFSPPKSPTENVTSTNTATGIIRPTPDLTRQNMILGDILKNGLSCEGDCLWGIYPKVTSLETAIGKAASTGLHLVDHYPGYYSDIIDFQGVGVEIILASNKDLVTAMSLRLYNLDKPTVDQSIWAGYSPQEVLRQYGEPSQILISIAYGHEPPSDRTKKLLYIIVFVYNEQKLIIDYTNGNSEEIQGNIKICPGIEQFSSVIMSYGEDKNLMLDTRGLTPIENASELSKTAFYRSIIEDPGVCVQLNSSSIPPG